MKHSGNFSAFILRWLTASTKGIVRDLLLMEYWLGLFQMIGCYPPIILHITSEMTLDQFRMRPSLLGDSMLKLDSTQVSDQDGDKCRFYDKFFEEWLNKVRMFRVCRHKSIIITQYFNAVRLKKRGLGALLGASYQFQCSLKERNGSVQGRTS